MDLTELVVGIGSAKAVVKTTQAAAKTTSSAFTNASSELRSALNKAKGVTSTVSSEVRATAKFLRRQTRSQLAKMNPRRNPRVRRPVETAKLPGFEKSPTLKPNIQLFAEGSTKKTRVGQWMAKQEYEQFLRTGEIPRTNVLTKGKEGYIRQANIGDFYVEFDVDSSLLAPKNEELGWALVKSKNKIQLKLAEQRGITLPDPIGTNIEHITVKGDLN